MDFQRGGFIDDFDLCVIMGNILDNALEACLKEDDSEKRFITINGGVRANQLIIY